jgi:hypothetical protein
MTDGRIENELSCYFILLEIVPKGKKENLSYAYATHF